MRVGPLEGDVVGSALGRLLLRELEHALGEVGAHDAPARADPLAELEREVAGAAAEVERRRPRLELGAVGRALAPGVVKARRHDRVQEVVDAGDAVEHAPHLRGELVLGTSGLAHGASRSAERR